MSLEAKSIDTSSHKGLIMPSLIWLAILCTALFAAYLRGVSWQMLWPIAGVAAFPALWSLMLSPVLRREWAQLLVIFGWLALAIIASILIGFIPMAVLFLCAPAAAALFEKEKVIEAMVMAAIFAGLIYYAGQLGYIPETQINGSQKLWGQQFGIIGTIGLLVTTLFAAARSKAAARPVMRVHQPFSVEAEQLLNSVHGAVMRLDEQNHLIFANNEARRLFSLAQGLSRMPLEGILTDDKKALGMLKDTIIKARAGGQNETVFIEAELEAGLMAPLNIHVAPLDDELILHICEGAEMAQKHALQARYDDVIRQSEDSALFFAGVSHELRTPLNAIIGFSDMMRSRLFGPLPGKYGEYADLIHDSGQHMLDVISDVLDLSKVEAGKYELHYESFDAADVVRSTVKMAQPLADKAKLRLMVGIHDELPLLIEADRKALRQILLNLISNAVKFSEPGSDVHITAKSTGTQLELRVKDEGAGISQSDIAKLGEPYQQFDEGKKEEQRGTGLGVSLVKSLTDLHKGSFAVESEIGQGTTVDITLPLLRADEN